MNQKGFIQISLLILIIGGLFFIAQPTEASFFDWFSWSKIKSIFTEEKIQENLPASVSEPIEGVSPSQEEPQKTSEEIQTETQECPVCPKPQTCEPIIKEIPVEKIVYRDNIIYKESQDCQIALSDCKKKMTDNFDLYYEREKKLNSCQTTTTDLITSYRGLLTEFDNLIDLTLGLNRDYLFQQSLSSHLLELKDFASTSRAFIGKFK